MDRERVRVRHRPSTGGKDSFTYRWMPPGIALNEQLASGYRRLCPGGYRKSASAQNRAEKYRERRNAGQQPGGS